MRTVVIPFKFQASEVELRILDRLLARAPAAFPQLLSVVKWLEGVENDKVRSMRERVQESVGQQLDSRLATQYALSILCAQKVKLYLQVITIHIFTVEGGLQILHSSCNYYVICSW